MARNFEAQELERTFGPAPQKKEVAKADYPVQAHVVAPPPPPTRYPVAPLPPPVAPKIRTVKEYYIFQTESIFLPVKKK